MYCWLKVLRECAEKASFMEEVEDSEYYWNIARELAQKENALTEADYKINDLYNPFNK